MGRLNGLARFALVLGFVLLGLRLVHVAIPIVYPRAGPGPYRVDSAIRASELAGFAVWMPSYRPQRAGPSPEIVVTRLGRSRVVVEWRGERWLRMTQTAAGRRGGQEPADDSIWQRSGVWQALARREGVIVRLETDLERRDLERVVSTLRAVGR